MARNALQVTINGKEFVSKEAKKAETSLTGLQKVGGIVNKALVASFAAAAAGIAASVAAMARAVSSTEKFADNIDKMSQKIGISREAFQEWDFILSQNGMNIDSLQTSIKTLANAAEEASRGTITYTRTFDALGISIYDTSGALKDQEDLLFDSISALSDMENTTLRTAYASDLFGRSATELAPLLNSGADSVENLRQKAHELGLVISDETIDAGVSLHDTMDQLRRTFQAVIAKAVTPLMGELDNLGQTFLDQVQEGGGLNRIIGVMVRWVSWSVDKIPKIAAVFEFVGSVIGITSKYAKIEIDKMLDGINTFLTDVGAIGVIDNIINFAVRLGGDMYQAIKKGFDTGDWSDVFGAGANIANMAIVLSVGLTIAKGLGAGLVLALQKSIGLVTSGVAGIGTAGLIGALSIAVGLIEAIGTGNWKKFKTDLSTAIYAGLLAAGLGYSGGAWVIAVSMSLGLGSFLEDWAEKNLTDELAQSIVDAIKEWWDRAVRLPLKYFWDDIGKDVWDGIIRGIKTFAKTIDIVGAVVDLVRNSFGKSKEVQNIGEETGENLIKGLGIGVEKSKDETKGIFSGLVDLWHKAWDEKSPSRVAIKTGENIDRGLVIGIGNYTSEVLDAWETLMGKLRDNSKVDIDVEVGSIIGDGEKPTQDSGGGYSLQRFGNAQPKVCDPSGGGIGDTLMSLFTRFGDLVKVMDTFQQVIDPVGTIFAGMMEVLGPAIDSILKPIVNVLKILGGTIGQILLPVFEAVGAVVEKLGEAFVWLYNKVIKPIGNFLIEAFNSIANGILRAVNGVISAINWAFGWLGVDIQKLALRDADQGKLADISMSQVMAGASSSVYSGSAPGSSTSVQQLNINVYQYFQGNVIGDGGMESVGEFTVRALQAYSGAGGNVQVVSA